MEFFHVLTDGTGGMVFLKTLAAEYLRLTGVQAEADDTLWDSDDLPLPAEYANEFARVPHSEKTSGFVDKPAVQMSGQLAKQKPCRILHFKMDAAALKAAAARYHGTVTVYLLALMFLSGRAATDETTGEASIQVPVNMRKFYPSPTVRNFALYCGIRQPLSMEADYATDGGKGFAGGDGGDAGCDGAACRHVEICAAGDQATGGQPGIWLSGGYDFQQYAFQPWRGEPAASICGRD